MVRGGTGDERHPAPAPGAAPGARLELWVPLVYAAFAGAWIATSDMILDAVASSLSEHTVWSVTKGFGFVVVTALLLHFGLRRALARERSARQSLEASESLLRAITDSIPDPVFLKDRDSRWIFANPATLRVIGKPAEEVIGNTDREIYGDPAVGQALIDTDRRVIESGVAQVVEERIQTPSGYRVYLSSKAPYRDPTGRIVGIIGNARDITERKVAEGALHEQLETNEQLRQAQKLESVGRLAGGVAHDLNNLLTIILGCAQALRESASRGAAANADDVEEIWSAGERARDLTRQLLAFGRRQAIAPVPLDLNAVVHASEKLLRRTLGEDVELRVDPEPALWAMRGDPGQLEQVVLNLAVNARDAMPRGGTLTIETRNVPGDGCGGARAAERAGDLVSLVVRDSGEGMSPEVKSHLFEPFFTTKASGRGTGLGLATVYGIVKQSGGQVHVASELGRGTAFTFTFPRTPDSPQAPIATPVSVPTRGTESILLVEDDAMVREVTVRILRTAGYRVVVAGDGREALALDPQDLGRIDLVVTDVIMPGLDGRSVADELRRRRSDLRVLYVSGYTEDEAVVRGVLDSGTDFLPKPFTPFALLGRVRAIFDRQPA